MISGRVVRARAESGVDDNHDDQSPADRLVLSLLFMAHEDAVVAGMRRPRTTIA